jgi:membrane-associated phospholipid phosphatase
LRNHTLCVLILATTTLGTWDTAWAQGDQELTQDPADTSEQAPQAPAPEPAASDRGLLSDIKLYFTAPLRWNGEDWAWFGGALVAIGASHHFDSQVRTHFTQHLQPGQSINSDDVPDIIPTVVVLAATWGYSHWTQDSAGEREAWAMLEAAGLSTVTAYGLKFAARRLGPDQTNDPNEWFKSGGKSFPSEHSTAAFAVGTVLAESGNDDYRWVRRFLGYGLGVVTSYLRLEHNAHWLSDTVGGAALGIASAHFAMNRTYGNTEPTSGLTVVPIPGGAMLTYRVTLQ